MDGINKIESVSVTRHGMKSEANSDLGRAGQNEEGKCTKGKRNEREEERKGREMEGRDEGGGNLETRKEETEERNKSIT